MLRREAAVEKRDAPSREGTRLVWADVAKAGSIVLVVLHHFLDKHFNTADWALDSPAESVWYRIDLFMQPMRMPVFFLLSGFFAASVVRRSWGHVRQRAFRSYYLYLVWLPLYFLLGIALGADNRVVASEIARLEDGHRLAAFLVAQVEPTTILWYVYALAAYLLVARAMWRFRIPLPAVFVVTVGLSIGHSASWLPGSHLTSSALGNAVYFLAGALVPDVVRALAARVTVPRAAAAGLALFAAVFGTRAMTDSTPPGFPFLFSLLGIVAGVSVAVLVARVPLVQRTGGYLGRNTLSIFLLHIPFIAAVTQVADSTGWGFADSALGRAGLFAYPALATVVISVASLAVHRYVLQRWTPWLLAPPRRRAATGDEQVAAPAVHEATSAV